MASKIYKEVNNAIQNEFGVTKDEVQSNIERLLDVRLEKFLKDSKKFETVLDKIIERKFAEFLTGKLTNSWRYGQPESQKIKDVAQFVLEKLLEEKLEKLFREQIDFKFHVSQKKKV